MVMDRMQGDRPQNMNRYEERMNGRQQGRPFRGMKEFSAAAAAASLDSFS
jgi:hypothetical protein